ncbi:MAG TPA: hypothetical protein VGL06_30970 [Pseudonocardiaceae bacterium]
MTAAVAAVAVVGIGTALAAGTGVLGGAGTGGAGRLATVLTPDGSAKPGASGDQQEPAETDESPEPLASTSVEPSEPAEPTTPTGIGRTASVGHIPPSTGRRGDDQEPASTITSGRNSDD